MNSLIIVDRAKSQRAQSKNMQYKKCHIHGISMFLYSYRYSYFFANFASLREKTFYTIEGVEHE